MPVNAQVTRRIDAPKEVVWAVLDDFANIASWSDGIQKSYTTGDQSKSTGLGAERRCELGGKKVLDERISDYVAGERMTIDVWNVEGLPLRSSQATFAVRAAGDGATEAIIDAAAEPKMPGFLVAILKPLVTKGISRGFTRLLDELATEAEGRVRA